MTLLARAMMLGYALFAFAIVAIGVYLFVAAKRIVSPKRDLHWWIWARIMAVLAVGLGLAMLWPVVLSVLPGLPPTLSR